MIMSYGNYVELKFFKNVLKLSSFSTVGQIIAVISLPLITRLFSPADFGLYSAFIAVVSLVGVWGTGMYHQVIVITDDSKEVVQLLFLTFLLSISLGFLTLGVATIANWLELFRSSEAVITYSGFFVLAVVLYAINQSMYALNTRRGHFNLMGSSNLTRDIIASSSKLALGYFGVLKLGLILGYLFSQSIFLVLLSIPFLKHIARDRLSVGIKPTSLLVLAQKYIDFPKKALPSNTIAVLAIQAPILFLGIIFNPEVLGYYALARTVLGLPLAVLGGSIMSVFQSEASTQFNANGNCQVLYQKLGFTIFSLGIIPVVLGMLFVGPLFELVFGLEWSIAGYYCAILMPLYLLRLIGKPLGYIFPLTKHLNFSLYMMLAFGFSSAGALGAGYVFNSPVLAVFLISITHSLCYLAMIYFGYQMSRGVKYAIK